LPKFELLEHTADVYVKAKGKNLADAMDGLGKGLTSVLVRNPKSVRAKEKKKITVEGHGAEELAYVWLGELIYLFDVEGFLFKEFDGEISESDGKFLLRGVARGERFDPSRHRPGTHVKAATYHNLRVEVGEKGATVTVLLDI